MSRKIGLGDTFFDPDIDGDIDYEFFGGETPTTTADPSEQGSDWPSSTQNSAVNSNPLMKSVNINNNINYDYEPMRNDDMRNLNRTGNAAVGHNVLMADIEIDDGSIAATNLGKKELKVMMNGEHSDCPPPTAGCDVDEVEEILNKKLHLRSCENHMAAEVSPRRNAEEANERGGGVKTKSSSSSKSPKDNGQATTSNDEEEGSSLSDCDSASDLYSLTDDEEVDVDEEEGNDYFVDNEGDLDSDITEVSPLSSANMSPLPDSPKRTPEPRVKRYGTHFVMSPRMGDRSQSEIMSLSSSSSSNNSEISHSKKKQVSLANREENLKQDSVDLKVLAKAIVELEEERKRNSNRRNKLATPEKTCVRSRKNMTFTNDEVRRIDYENKRLLRKIIDSQKPRKTSQHPLQTGRIASSAINRFKEFKKIETENLVLLKRLQAAKPTRELSREFLLGHNHKRIPESKSSSSIATTRTASPFVVPIGTSMNQSRGVRCCSMGSLHSNSSNFSGINTTSPTKSKSSKLTNGVGTSHSIASEQ